MKLFGFTKNEGSGTLHQQKKQAGLVVIAVDPSFQGKGYGALLLTDFEFVCLKRGFSNLYLSVRQDNLRAIKSYRDNGWEISTTSNIEFGMEKFCKLPHV